MRSTRETELADKFPMHVVNKWMGNIESVAIEHYLQVTVDHFRRAVSNEVASDENDFDIDSLFDEATQNPTQTVRDFDEFEMTEPDSEKSQGADVSGSYGQSHRKSLTGKDLQTPPRGVEPLFPG